MVRAQDSSSQFVGDPKYPAPEFASGLDWLNVPAPLTMKELRGKVVLLDFWTYGCINCIHMIPIVKQLEQKYGDALAVVGVHSAKFANEGNTENIREIIQRYGLEHPVINDKDFVVWNAYAPYGVNAWPTFAVIDPRGNLFAVQAGEIPFEAFDTAIGGMVKYFDEQKEIDRKPLAKALEKDKQPPAALAFPGKILADPDGGRLFIADSSHNRIVIADLSTYEVLDVIGSGQVGFKDGSYTEATFSTPQGMALDGTTLYVADTNNHAIRAIDLGSRAVTTLAGTGEQSYDRAASGDMHKTPLSSPWDVAFDGSQTLYIAMAGLHQIWALHLDSGTVEALIGSGQEGLQDGQFKQAQLAQPSGLYFANNTLYFTDPESSSVRAADITNFLVTTLAGPDSNNLFDFGDKDGGFGTSRLQHALGITGGPDGTLYIADTYNSKIKQLDPVKKEVKTLFGGDRGLRDGDAVQAEFYEPGGLSFADGKLYVADTNNQAVRIIDLSAKTVSTLIFPNPEALQIGGQVTVIGSNTAQGEALTLPEQTVAPGQGQIVLDIKLPDGYKLNGIAPFTSAWASSGDAIQIADADKAQSVVAPALPIKVPVTLKGGEASLTGELVIYYCEAVKESLCFIDQVKITAPVKVDAAGSGTDIHLERAVTPPKITAPGGIG
jgi:DNA-binding beta-propeller fold protein YncE